MNINLRMDFSDFTHHCYILNGTIDAMKPVQSTVAPVGLIVRLFTILMAQFRFHVCENSILYFSNMRLHM